MQRPARRMSTTRSCRDLTRAVWREEFDPTFDQMAEMEARTAAHIVIDDRRRGVSIGVVRGRDEMADNIRVQDELFGPTTFLPIAVRGDHLALLRTRSVSETGFELVSLAIAETNNAGKYCAWTFFDEADLRLALETLYARYEEIRVDAPGVAESGFARAACVRPRRLGRGCGVLGTGLRRDRPSTVGLRAGDGRGVSRPISRSRRERTGAPHPRPQAVLRPPGRHLGGSVPRRERSRAASTNGTSYSSRAPIRTVATSASSTSPRNSGRKRSHVSTNSRRRRTAPARKPLGPERASPNTAAGCPGAIKNYDFFSVLDIEGVAQRPVEIGARLEVEVAHCVGVE